MSCNRNEKNRRCDQQVDEHRSTHGGCSPLDVCLGLGRSLIYDGKCFREENKSSISDGWYGEVKIKNGCIVDVRGSKVFEYTPPPCASDPSPCGGGGGGGSGGSVSISSTPGNQLSRYPDGLYSKTYIEGNSGIYVVGSGTVADPYKISYSADQSGNKTYVNGSSIISVIGNGSQINPFTISHNTTNLAGGTYGQFTIDEYGHVTGYNEASDNDGILAVLGGTGVHVETNRGIATVSIPNSGVEHGTYKLGGFSVNIDARGSITNISRDINLNSGPYIIGDKEVVVNEVGSITSIKDNPQLPRNHYVATFSGSRQEMSITFLTTQQGNFKISYRGYLGDIPSTNGHIGPIPYTGNLVFQVDNRSIVPYVIVSNNHIIEAFVYTELQYSPGEHTVSISASADTPIEETGHLEVTLVQKV